MRLRYSQGDQRIELHLTEHPVTIGRSPEADLVIEDEKASRLHCGIRFQDGKFILKDLKSKNGTYLNEQRIEEADLQPGDRIRVGSIEFWLESDEGPGATTAVQEMEDEMAHGKGYGTILREIVNTTDEAPPKRKPGRHVTSE